MLNCHIILYLSNPIPCQPPKRFYKVFVIHQLILPTVAPPTGAFVYSILQLLAYSVNASSRHWQNVLLLEDIRKDAVGKRYVRLICICLIKCLYILLFYFYKITSMQKRPSPLCEARKSISIENKKSDVLKNKRVCYLTGWF